MNRPIARRDLLSGLAAGAAGLALSGGARGLGLQRAAPVLPTTAYRGPNVVFVRFGGGVRRRETIAAEHTYCPYLFHELVPRGTFFPELEISSGPGIETGHGTGTLYLLTGRYDRYEDLEGRVLGERYEPKAPTLFEYLRKSYDVPAHETLIVNGEDRIDEEFYTFSNHHLYGVNYRSQVLSLYRFKTWLLERRIATGRYGGFRLTQKQRELERMRSLDLRVKDARPAAPEIDRFWEQWSAHYGDSGLVNPRGDRLLTELAVRALHELKPRLLMVNYQDCDYVHWGTSSHYTRGISIMDEGLRRLVEAVEGDAFYRDNTIFVVVPDCGRDHNRMMSIPYQHHFGSRSSREIFALFLGPGVPSGTVIGHSADQIQVAATVGRLMGVETGLAEGAVLEEAIA